MSSSVERVRQALAAAGLSPDIVTFDASTRTADDAAKAIGCSVAQIAKSLIFKGATSGRAVLVIASGSNRVDEGKLAAIIGEPTKRADADFVRAETGFAIGGVPPAGHLNPPITVLDADLARYAEIWAAAGTPRTVFRLTPEELSALTGAPFHTIAAEAAA